MTNSETDDRLAKRLGEILDLLDIERLRHEIDVPIDEGAANFTASVRGPATHDMFNRYITEFTRDMFANCIQFKQNLSTDQAFAEAVALLETAYRGMHERGYKAAFLEASRTDYNGMGAVLVEMAAIIKDRERNKHERWVFDRYINHLDWQSKRRIAEILRARRAAVPQDLLGRVPDDLDELADSLPALIRCELRDNEELRQDTPNLW